MRDTPLPLLLLSGFLGSGKTSTLRHWLEQTGTPLERVAVVINDFGEMNVDAGLLARRQMELRSITGGCVCCQSFEDLVAQVAAIAENPKIDLLWIETSGLADPEEVIDHLSAPELAQSTVLRRMILVVDASDFPCSWRGRAVQAEQVRYADVLLLNKIDRVDATRRQRVEIELRKLNPTAEIIVTEHGRIDPARLTGDASMRSGAIPAECGCGHDHEHEHADHAHDHHHHHNGHGHEAVPHAASTLFVPLKQPVERGAFQKFLGALPSSVFRAKGFIRLSDSPEKVHTFQQVRDQAELLLLPLEGGEDFTTGLVFIGPQLDEARIRTLAEKLGQP
jgi:G3E family GTPase